MDIFQYSMDDFEVTNEPMNHHASIFCYQIFLYMFQNLVQQQQTINVAIRARM